MKLSDLGREFGLKAHEILNLAKENGFEITAHSQNITENEENELRVILSGKKDEEIDQYDHCKMVGVYFDHRKRKYKLYSLIIPRDEMKNFQLVEEYEANTIYKLQNHIGVVFSKINFFVESMVEKILVKRKNK